MWGAASGDMAAGPTSAAFFPTRFQMLRMAPRAHLTVAGVGQAQCGKSLIGCVDAAETLFHVIQGGRYCFRCACWCWCRRCRCACVVAEQAQPPPP